MKIRRHSALQSLLRALRKFRTPRLLQHLLCDENDARRSIAIDLTILLFHPTILPKSSMVLMSHSYYLCGQNNTSRATTGRTRIHDYHLLELVYPTQIYENRLRIPWFLGMIYEDDFCRTLVRQSNFRRLPGKSPYGHTTMVAFR